MAALHRACFPIYLVLLTLGGFASANRHLKETPHHQKTAALKNLQGSDHGSGSVGVGNTIGGVLVGIHGGYLPAVFPGITIPGVSVGVPGVSISIPGISVGMPGVSVVTPGVSVHTPGISVGTPGVSVGIPGVPCAVYIPGIGCVYSAVQLHAVSGGRLAHVPRAEMDETHQVASKNSIGQEAGKDHEMVPN